MLYHKLH